MNGKRNHEPSADNSDGQNESIDHELQADDGVTSGVTPGASAGEGVLEAARDTKRWRAEHPEVWESKMDRSENVASRIDPPAVTRRTSGAIG